MSKLDDLAKQRVRNIMRRNPHLDVRKIITHVIASRAPEGKPPMEDV